MASLYPFPYPIEKVKNSPYPYPYQSMQRFPVKIRICLDNTHKKEFIFYLYTRWVEKEGNKRKKRE